MNPVPRRDGTNAALKIKIKMSERQNTGGFTI